MAGAPKSQPLLKNRKKETVKLIGGCYMFLVDKRLKIQYLNSPSLTGYRKV